MPTLAAFTATAVLPFRPERSVATTVASVSVIVRRSKPPIAPSAVLIVPAAPVSIVAVTIPVVRPASVSASAALMLSVTTTAALASRPAVPSTAFTSESVPVIVWPKPVSVIVPVVFASNARKAPASIAVSFTPAATSGLKFNPLASSTNRVSAMVPFTFVTADASAQADVFRSIV